MDILMAVVGALSIYLGYRLFCDSAYRKNRLRHLVSGALLAVLGVGVLIADVRSVRTARTDSQVASHRAKSTKEGSFATPKINKRTSVPERLA